MVSMALTIELKDTKFGVGDKIRVSQKIKEGAKERSAIFEGLVISIRGKGTNASFVVRKIGASKVGIERIFPLSAPTIEKVEVIKTGTPGVRHAKLYYVRDKSPREIDKIYSRTVSKKAKK